MQRWTAALTLGGLIVLSVALLNVADHVASLDGGITRLVKLSYQTKTPMQTLSEQVSPGSDPNRIITVTTKRIEGETVDAFLARHNQAVQAVINS